MRANLRILKHLADALAAAKLTNCAVDKKAQDAMKLYLDTWVVMPLEEAIKEMTKERVTR